MNESDAFSRQLLEEAKRFLELSSGCDDPIGKVAFLHASLLVAFCGLEAYVNSIADEMLVGQSLTIHERGLLSESEVRLEEGEFKITNSLKMVRLEDRIHFLHFKYSQKRIDKSAQWWSEFKAAADLRNRLTHPKAPPTINKSEVERAINSVINVLNVIFKAVYKREFPPANRGLNSTLDFK